MGFFDDIFNRRNSQNATDSQRIKDFMKELSKSSPTAKKLLEESAKNGVKFRMDGGMSGHGAYDGDTNCILLNPRSSDKQLLETLVHEVRHSVQKLDYSSANTIQSALKINRALEADAWAFSCAAAYEMRTVRPDVLENMRVQSPDVVNAYIKEMQTSQDSNRALGAAFKGWYKDEDYVSRYDQDLVDFMQQKHSPARSLLEVSNNDIARKLCCNGSKSYLDADFLGMQAAMTIKQKIYDQAVRVEKRQIPVSSWSVRRTSVDNFFVKQPDDRIRKPLTHQQPPTVKPVLAKDVASMMSDYFR